MICLQDVHFAYGREEILHGVSLMAQSGKLTVLLGPNGCGKTTVLRMMSGYLAPSGGQVLLDGRAVAQYSARERARLLALIPQRVSLQFDFTAQEVVEMGRNPHRGRLQPLTPEDRQAVRGAMEQTGVWDMREKAITTLSGGELQRVMIARALAQQSKVLLMDEPVSNLDVRHKAEVLALVRRLAHEKGLCAVCVLHELELAGAFADELILMKEGTVAAGGREAFCQDNIRNVFGVDAAVDLSGEFPRITVQYQNYRT